MTLAWTAFGLYVVVTFGLSWLGSRKTGDLRSFALGGGDMKPWVVGLALAASMASTATFVINPGIVYAYGISAVLGYGLAAGLGLSVGIVVLSLGFRRSGAPEEVLTLPQWIGRGHRGITLFYAGLNLLLVAMVVLICYAMAGLLMATLDLASLVPVYTFEVALLIVVGFVFSYVFFGGTYAHAYTNTVQGIVMVAVAVLLVASGFRHLWDGSLLRDLAAVDPALATAVNPGSLLFRNLFEVFGVNLLVGFALACQPHFLIKALYVKSEGDVRRYLAVAVGTGILYNLVLLCGLYARRVGAPIETFIAEQGMGIDGVMPAYIVTVFPEAVGVLVSIALLAAGMSTLDGILVALSAIVANDIFLNLRPREAGQSAHLAFRVGRLTLVAIAVLAFVLSIVQHRTKELSVALFAQEGVYALFAATFVPVLAGVFAVDLPRKAVVASSLVALAVHFGFRYGELTLLTAADHSNPGLTATWGLLASLAVAAGALVAEKISGGKGPD